VATKAHTRKGIVLLLVCAAQFMVVLDIAFVNVALPRSSTISASSRAPCRRRRAQQGARDLRRYGRDRRVGRGDRKRSAHRGAIHTTNRGHSKGPKGTPVHSIRSAPAADHELRRRYKGEMT
jgi:hypothetical protein